MSLVTVYAVFANAGEAQRIGRLMVEEKRAACVNLLGGVSSIYRWQGKIEEAVECAALFKTSSEAADRLIARIAELHSYDVPCVESWPVGHALKRYADWVEDNIAG